MKNLLIIFSITFIICSCSKLNEFEENNSTDFTSIWKLKKKTINNVEQNISECELRNFFDIADNNILLYYTYEQKTTNCESKTNDGTWSFSGKGLVINWSQPINGEDIYDYEILELTSNTLRIRRELPNGSLLEEIYN